jgi:predicted nuclease of restriction endonuclease-like (RecB) superfamily
MAKKKTQTKKEKQPASLPSSYPQILKNIKVRIHEAKVKASLNVNQELIKLYWEVGQIISEKQKNEKWGSGVIDKLGKDLQKDFPGIEGFSRGNIFFMRSFYLAYQKVQQAARQFETLPIFHIPWWHNVILLTKLKDNGQRLWYAKRAIEKGWSRSNLEMWIESNLYDREGNSITNFETTLPKPDSDIAQQLMRDPYCLDFLMLSEEAKEKEIEQGLMDHLQKFLLELGEGFAFVGRQYPLCVEGETYSIDLLFFNLKLRCYVVVELKAREFNLRDTGQMHFYISAVNDMLRHPEDRPTIGILLCKSKKKLKARYAIGDLKTPISISSYELIVKSLPKELKPSLPSIEQIEEELNKDLKKN